MTAVTKRRIEGMSGFCQARNHYLCHWGPGAAFETPSAIVTCPCSCHLPATPVVKGPSGRVMVPKA